MKGKRDFDDYKQLNQSLARKFLISLDTAVTNTNNSQSIKNMILKMNVKFLTVFTKLVTEKIVKALSFEDDNQQATDLIHHSHCFIDG